MATHPIGGKGPTANDPLATPRSRAEAPAGVPADPAKGATSAEVKLGAAAGEKVQISREARRLLEMSDLMSTARKALDEAPDVRAERVQEVRSRLAAGVYQTDGIRAELAHRLTSILRDLDVEPPPDDPSD